MRTVFVIPEPCEGAVSGTHFSMNASPGMK